MLSVLNMTAAFCFVRLIETLSHPSMFKRGPAQASYLDLLIIPQRVFVPFEVYRSKFGRDHPRHYGST